MVSTLFSRIDNLVKSIHQLREICLPDYNLTIEYLTIFSKDVADYQSLKDLFEKQGIKTVTNNGLKFELNNPIQIHNESINLVRIRQPDIHRTELGCGDLNCTLKQYGEIRNLALQNGWDIIIRQGYEMIELSTFELPVYAYLIMDT